MKYLKLFENFDLNDFDYEIDLIINSLLEIEDEYNLTQINQDDERLGNSYNNKIDDNCYYYSYYEDDDKLIFKVNLYLKIDDDTKSSWIPVDDIASYSGISKDSLEKVYPGLVDYIKSWIKDVSKKLKLGNDLEHYLFFLEERSWPDNNDSMLFCNIEIKFEIKHKDTNEVDIEKKINNYIKNSLGERFKYKNISYEDVLNCIKNNGFIYSNIVKRLPNNDPELPLKPLDIDNDGLISVDYEGKIYEVDLEDVIKIDVP